MHRLLALAALVLAFAACGGKAKSSSDPTAATCCCTSSDGREVVADMVCEERGGTCDPAETCEATDPSPDGEGGGGSDPDDY